MFTFYMTRIWAFFLHFNRPRTAECRTMFFRADLGQKLMETVMIRGWIWAMGGGGPFFSPYPSARWRGGAVLHLSTKVLLQHSRQQAGRVSQAAQPENLWHSCDENGVPLASRCESSCAMLCHAFRKWRLLCEAPNETRSGNPTGHFRKALVTTSLSLVFAYI